MSARFEVTYRVREVPHLSHAVEANWLEMNRDGIFLGTQQARTPDLGIMTTTIDLTHLTSVRRKWCPGVPANFPHLADRGHK